MSSVWALQDAKNKFSAVVDRAQDLEPQIVTRRGKPVVVVMSYSTFKAQTPQKQSFVDFLLGGPKINGGLRVERETGPMREVEFA